MSGEGISSEVIGGVRVVGFSELMELDSARMDRLQESLYDAVLGERGGRVVLDLSNVAYAGSQALGALVTLRLRANRNGITLLLAGVTQAVDSILRITQIDRLFEAFPTVEAALAHLQKPQT